MRDVDDARRGRASDGRRRNAWVCFTVDAASRRVARAAAERARAAAAAATAAHPNTTLTKITIALSAIRGTRR